MILITIELMQTITQQTLRVGGPHCWGFSDWLVSEALYSMDETSSSIFLWYHGGRLTRAMRLTSALLRESAADTGPAQPNADAEDEYEPSEPPETYPGLDHWSQPDPDLRDLRGSERF